MSTYDTWKIAVVLPEDFQEFGDWAVQSSEEGPGLVGRVYHKHESGRQITLYMVKDNYCRNCGAQAPPGVLFLARASGLEALGVTDAS